MYKLTLKESFIMKKIILALALFAAISSISACETVAGAGRDLEKAGEAVQRAAD